MNSLKEVYATIAHQDHIKVAQYNDQYGEPDYEGIDEGLLKQAQDYDHIGRILAHDVFADMLKTAADEMLPGASDEEKAKALAALLAMANGKQPEGGGEEEDEEGEQEEKKASIRAAVLHRMSQDPEYVSALVGKYYGR